jgi:hypothetical protein
MTTQELSLAVGDGGWVRARFKPRDLSWQTAYVRFTPDGTRWRAVELWLPDPSPGLLRALPLNRIVHAVNASDESGQIAFGLAAGHKNPSPADLPAHFKDKRRRVVQRYRLEKPATRRLPPDFYQRVARAYRGAVEAGRNPRKTLAEDSGAPADTVARWILEARRRRYLPPADPGKVSP